MAAKKYLDETGLARVWAAIKATFAPMSHVDDETHIPLIIGTQTAKTGAWTGSAPTISELRDGQTIRYWLPEEPSGNATLNLTLADGTQTGAKNVYFRATTRLTTHLAVNNWGVFTYRENVQIGSSHYTGWWYSYGYYVDTVSRTRADNLRPVAGDSIIYGRNIVMEDGTGVFRSVTNSNSTNTSHTPCVKGFKNPSEMFYYSYSSNVAVGATMANNYMYSAYNALDFRYNSNCGTSLVPNHPIYLIFEHKADGLYYLKTGTWWTQSLPVTEDGYVYVYVGHAYSTSYYNFAPSHPMLWYHNGKIVPYAGECSGGGSGDTSDAYTKAESDARYGAVATATGYWLAPGSGSSILNISMSDPAFACIITCHAIEQNVGGAYHWAWLMSKAAGAEVAISKLCGNSDVDLTWDENLEFASISCSSSASTTYEATIAMKPIYGTCPSTEYWE